MSVQPASPRVSIITATYNYSSVLWYAIQSALRQTFQDFEYLVIGDGCTDDSEQVVASFRDPRLRWHNLPTNSGSQSAPNNQGLELARGEFIAYLGHDDVWYPTHLEKLVQTLDETQSDWAHALTVMIGPPGSNVSRLIGLAPPGTSPDNMLFMTSAVMHKRALVSQIGKWKDYRTLELPPDREYHTRAAKSGAHVAVVENVSVFKFPSAWRRNVYREKPCHEQARYLERIENETDFLQNELLSIIKTYQFKTWDAWLATSDVPGEPTPTAPLGSMVESWRRYRGLSPNVLTPRPWWEIVRIRIWRALADVTRPARQIIYRASRTKSK